MTATFVEDERDHYCRRCGRWLLATTVPMGTPGIVRLVCPDRECQRTNNIKLGCEPLPRPDRAGWVATMQERRRLARVGTSF